MRNVASRRRQTLAERFAPRLRFAPQRRRDLAPNLNLFRDKVKEKWRLFGIRFVTEKFTGQIMSKERQDAFKLENACCVDMFASGGPFKNASRHGRSIYALKSPLTYFIFC